MSLATFTTAAAPRDEGQEVNLFAFWPYDCYPYVLGGVANRMYADGTVAVASYGGSRFTPIRLLPVEAGTALFARIEELRAAERHALDAHKATWARKVVDLLPEVGTAQPFVAKHAVKAKAKGA